MHIVSKFHISYSTLFINKLTSFNIHLIMLITCGIYIITCI